MPKLSIVLPTLNCRGMLPRHIESMAGWLHLAHEVIVVDSCSRDGTVEFIQENLRHDRVRMFSRPRGLYQAWNFGIEQTTGDWIYFSTVGDSITPGLLQHLCDTGESLQCDVVASRPAFISEDGQPLPRLPWPIDHILNSSGSRRPVALAGVDTFLFAVMAIPNALLGSSASNVYRGNHLRARLFPTEFGTVGDTAWSLRYGLTTRYGFTPERGSCFRLHEKAYSKNEYAVENLALKLAELARQTLDRPDHPAEVQAAVARLKLIDRTAVVTARLRQAADRAPRSGAAATPDVAAASGNGAIVQPNSRERGSLPDQIRAIRQKLEGRPADAVDFSRRSRHSEALRVAFFTTLNHNVGDEFIREGVRAILDTARVDYAPYFICKHKPATISTVWPEEVADIGDKYWNADVVVQAGAPVYWHLCGGKSTSLTSEWHDWFWRRRVLGPRERQHPLFLNLGAGSCFAWGEAGGRFVADPRCAEFARQAAARAALTTVRDPVAQAMLEQLGVDHVALPCPAFLAGSRHNHVYRPNGPIGVNLMPLGGHFALDDDFDQAWWLEECLRLLGQLRTLGRLFFVAHSADEEAFLAQLTRTGEVVFRSDHWRAYLEAFSQCSLVVANRVHAAVCSAGLGVPAVILGNDSRAEIGRFIGVPIFRSGHASAATVVADVEKLWADRSNESVRLRGRRDEALARYAALIQGLDLNWRKPDHEPAASAGQSVIRTDGPAASPCIMFSKTDALGDQILASGFVKTMAAAYPGHHVVWLVRDGMEVIADLIDGARVWAPSMHRSPAEEAGRLRAGAQPGGLSIVPVPLHPFRSGPTIGTTSTWWAGFVGAIEADLAMAGSVTVNWVDQFLVGASGSPVRYGFVTVKAHQRLPEPLKSLWPPQVRQPFTIEAAFKETRDELGYLEQLAGMILDRPVSLAPALAPQPIALPDEIVRIVKESLVIAPGAGAPGRSLPPATAAEAVERFLSRRPALGLRRVVLIEGPGDREFVAELNARLRARKVPVRVLTVFSDQLPSLVAVLRQAPLFLCNDTSYVHLAAFLGTPTVAIWGLGHWPRFVCRSGSVTIVRTELACKGCEWDCCFEKWECVQRLPAAAVTAALLRRLENNDHGVEIAVTPPVLADEAVTRALARRGLTVAIPSATASPGVPPDLAQSADEPVHGGAGNAAAPEEACAANG